MGIICYLLYKDMKPFLSSTQSLSRPFVGLRRSVDSPAALCLQLLNLLQEQLLELFLLEYLERTQSAGVGRHQWRSVRRHRRRSRGVSQQVRT